MEDVTEQEKLRILLSYFTTNKAGLVPYRQRNIAIPEPKDGLEFRGAGAMESNICSIIAHRMKGRKASWSIKGGENLARLLCLKSTKRLCETLEQFSQMILPLQLTEEVVLALSSAKIPLREGKGYNGYTKSSIPPMKWAKGLLGIKFI